MAIKRIKVKNFKSFKDLDVELGDLNILIGANASGKSNFVEIFRFLRIIEDSGLEEAISAQESFKYLRRLSSQTSETLSLEVISDQEFWLHVEGRNDELVKIEIHETIYKIVIDQIAIGIGDLEPGCEIAEERLTHKCNFLNKAGKRLGTGKIVLSNAKRKVSMELDKPEEVPITEDDIFPRLSYELPSSTSPLLGSNFRFLLSVPRPSPSSDRIFRDISIYDLDPKTPKGFASGIGKPKLEEDGSNLVIVLRNIMRNEDAKRKLLNLVTCLLDFVDDLDVERVTDWSYLLKVRETYFEEFLPAFVLSDGTINMLALIVALYFEKNPLIIIEEPDRHIHPYLISEVVDMMEDASENKQIIVTTHNPEMVRYANSKDILLISRDEEGFSSICRPSEKEDVKVFLEHGLRMERLYVDDFLET